MTLKSKIFLFSFLSLTIFSGVCMAASQASSSLPQVSPPTSLPELKKKGIEAPLPKGRSVIPSPPDLKAKSYILIDADSGHVIAEKDANEKLAPASLTKLMTLYVAANALHSGQMSLTDKINVSEKAWKSEGSRMFIKVGTEVSAQDLIKGIVIASGNDAAVAMAEHLGGSEDSFVELMNQVARGLNMNSTSFMDSSGISKGNYSTALDLAILARAWVLNFPEYYPWFKEKWMTYNGIKQPNRNRLLWRDNHFDGIKTGNTDAAGYCLVASAKRDGMRLISVVMGAKDDTERTNYSVSLLNYGFRFFESRKIFAADSEVIKPKVLFGKENNIQLVLKEDLYVTVPKGKGESLKAKAQVSGTLKAPLVKGQKYGELNVTLGDEVIVTKPLVALNDNPKANFLYSIFDYISLLFNH